MTRRDETPAVDRARDLLAQAAAADPSAEPAVDVALAALDGLGDPVEGLPGSPERARLDALVMGNALADYEADLTLPPATTITPPEAAVDSRWFERATAAPRDVCIHCGETLHLNGQTWVHTTGLQASKGTCALDPYGKYMATPVHTLAAEHFHGCPDPTGRPFDCDWCQDRARGMSE